MADMGLKLSGLQSCSSCGFCWPPGVPVLNQTGLHLPVTTKRRKGVCGDALLCSELTSHRCKLPELEKAGTELSCVDVELRLCLHHWQNITNQLCLPSNIIKFKLSFKEDASCKIHVFSCCIHFHECLEALGGRKL